MKSLKKKRRIQVILLTFAALVISTGMIGYAMRDGINFFRSPSEIAATPPSPDEYFRIGGLVVEGSIRPDEGVRFFFEVTDGGAIIPARYVGNDPRPDLFNEGQGMVGEGHFVDGVFIAYRILARHDETYMPAEVIDALKAQGVYQEPNG